MFWNFKMRQVHITWIRNETLHTQLNHACRSKVAFHYQNSILYIYYQYIHMHAMYESKMEQYFNKMLLLTLFQIYAFRKYCQEQKIFQHIQMPWVFHNACTLQKFCLLCPFVLEWRDTIISNDEITLQFFTMLAPFMNFVYSVLLFQKEARP